MVADDFASVRQLFAELPGPLIQTPPAYSAVKVNGRKAYEYARQGISVELKPRTVHIYECKVIGIRSEPELEADFLIACSKGTYIRTICDDIGKKTGFGAYAIRLRRTRCGAFDEAEAHTPEEIEQAFRDGSLESLILPEEICVRHLQAFELTEGEAEHIRNGRLLPLSDFVGRVEFPVDDLGGGMERNMAFAEKTVPRYRAMRDNKLIAVVYPEILEDNIILKIERMLDER
jgi:tRNA pseudouridine55 synthase